MKKEEEISDAMAWTALIIIVISLLFIGYVIGRSLSIEDTYGSPYEETLEDQVDDLNCEIFGEDCYLWFGEDDGMKGKVNDNEDKIKLLEEYLNIKFQPQTCETEQAKYIEKKDTNTY